MNEILQQRIEEAAEEFANSTTSNLLNVFETTGRFEGFEQGATFALQNQWISVDEELPEVNKNTKLSDKCFIARKREFGCPDWFGDGYYDKDMGWINHGNRISNITHWMPIPSLKGGEK